MAVLCDPVTGWHHSLNPRWPSLAIKDSNLCDLVLQTIVTTGELVETESRLEQVPLPDVSRSMANTRLTIQGPTE